MNDMAKRKARLWHKTTVWGEQKVTTKGKCRGKQLALSNNYCADVTIAQSWPDKNSSKYLSFFTMTEHWWSSSDELVMSLFVAAHRKVSPLVVLTHGHYVYVGIMVLIFDVQSNLNDVHVIRY